MTNLAAAAELLEQRRAGVLLHPTSLPGPADHGTLGHEALKFIDFLQAAGFAVWQTLPLGPVDEFYSPYSLSSAFAGDIRLIDPEMLGELSELPDGLPLAGLHAAPLSVYSAFVDRAGEAQAAAFDRFMQRQRHWLVPFAMFEHYSNRFDGNVWWEWPLEYAACERRLLFEEFADDEAQFQALAFRQYLFDLQWSAVKEYANTRGISVFGDMPFYVDRNSADVWWRRDLFLLDENAEPLAVAGVPPDYFSEEGQLWGNPLFNWEAMQSDGFQWWNRRLMHQLERFDLLRIDHFRALEAYWSVPADAESARDGEWLPGYGDELLESLSSSGKLPLVAEDLGIITTEVRELRDRHGLPGMAVMQFGFDGSSDNPHLPQNVAERSVLYTGTHDNDTLLGWYAGLDEGTHGYIAHALQADPAELPQCIVRMTLESRANLAMISFQDLLGLGSEARMNTPGVSVGNWRWRFSWDEVDETLASNMRKLIDETNRLGTD